MLPNTCANPRIGKLQDDGCDATNKKRYRIFENAPGHGMGWQQRRFAWRASEISLRAVKLEHGARGPLNFLSERARYC